MTYSLTEAVIGTWIDGKPVYQVVLPASTTNIASLDMDRLIYSNAFNSDGSSVVNSRGGLMYINNNTVNFSNNSPDYYVLRYTKTSDSASS